MKEERNDCASNTNCSYRSSEKNAVAIARSDAKLSKQLESRRS